MSEPTLHLYKIVETIFVGVVEFELSNNPSGLKKVVHFEIDSKAPLNLFDLCTESAATLVGESSSDALVVKHIGLTRKLLTLMALPFLPDESLTEFEFVLAAHRRSWTELKCRYSVLFSSFEESSEDSVLNNLDSTLVTFIEWLDDVNFFHSHPQQRKIYLAEFPFSRRYGERF